MCSGLEIGLAAALFGTSLFGKKEQAAAAPSYVPPKVEVRDPAAAAPTVRAPNATVRVGDTVKKTNGTNAADYEGFVERRLSGKALGGLGRGGLGL